MPFRPQETLVAEQFGPRAASYLTSTVHAQGEDLAYLADLVGNRHGAVALDLGCGGGHAAYRLAPLVRRIVAYDLSDAMLDVTREEARHRGLTNLEVRRGVVEELPFPDRSFDIVVSRYSAHHWHDAPRALREARRVMKRGGMAVFMDVFAPSEPLLDTWLQTLELLRDSSHVRNYALGEWRGMLSAANFAPAATRCYRVVLQFRAWIERMNTHETYVDAIRALQAAAPQEVVRHFEIRSDGTFTVDAMLMQAHG